MPALSKYCIARRQLSGMSGDLMLSFFSFCEPVIADIKLALTS